MQMFKPTADQNVLRWIKNAYKAKRLTFQQYRTLRGQVLAGDPIGAVNGLRRILKTKETQTTHAET